MIFSNAAEAKFTKLESAVGMSVSMGITIYEWFLLTFPVRFLSHIYGILAYPCQPNFFGPSLGPGRRGRLAVGGA